MKSGPERLTIIHTNDIHSHFEMMSPAAAEIFAMKAAAGDEPVLLLDIGDHMDRAAVETEGTMGQANIDIMNLTGYDAVTIGNNEGLTFSKEMLSAVFTGLQCPVVCCNFLDAATGEPPHWMQRHAILEKDGIRIGLTGATAAFTSFYSLLGWDVLDPEEALREQCELLAPQVDLLIILSHLGLPADQKLAEHLEGVHAILGGHTHHMLEQPQIIAGTAVCGAGKFGRYAGRLVFEREHPGAAFRLAEGGCTEVDPLLQEETISRAAAIHLTRGREALEETVAISDRMLPLDLQGSPRLPTCWPRPSGGSPELRSRWSIRASCWGRCRRARSRQACCTPYVLRRSIRVSSSSPVRISASRWSRACWLNTATRSSTATASGERCWAHWPWTD